MVGDLSSSNNEVQGRKATSSTGRERRRKWLKRRERWIVILGVILHAIYMLSIFDIYFKTPIVHGMDLVTPSFSAPAKRLVLLVADGLRADKFYEPDNEGKYRAPFLRNVIKHRGRWGVSHARPPTESRPGHVSIIAGFYEDPSAVTKGWKANPVEFDSVFNRSQHTISYGSPDIVPIFCGALSHSTWNTYPHEFEDFATGSHGDGHRSNTDTPLVAWGAGVKHPMPTFGHDHNDYGTFVDDHVHDMPTPKEWGLGNIERVDVNQADIAPLMSALLGLPCPANSVGSLPLGYINLNKAEEVEAVLANAKQILNQFLRKSQLKQESSLSFKPFKPLAHYSLDLEQINSGISDGDYESAMKLAVNLRRLALEGLDYFQTYDWLMLMTVVTLGYIGWMFYLILHVLQSYTTLPGYILKMEQAVSRRNSSLKANLCGSFFMAIVVIILFLEHSPPLYHAYSAMTVFLWTQIFSEYQFLNALWRYLRGREHYHTIKLVATCLVSVFILEVLVKSFTERKLYTWCFLIVGLIAPVYLSRLIARKSGTLLFMWLSCWFLSVFTLMPAEIPDNTLLVVGSGAMIITVGGAARYLDRRVRDNKYWSNLLNCDRKTKFPFLFELQSLLIGLSSVMVLLSTSHRTKNRELLALHQLINWLTAGFSMALPLFSATGLLSRLTSIFLGFAPAFLLLSIGYEAVFYGALALALMAWILFENALLHYSKTSASQTSIRGVEDNFQLENENRSLQLSDMRIPLVFVVLFNVAFFGTGNFASIASFEISSVYRFITIFSPFLMAALLIFKLLIPFLLVICAFSAITKLVRVPRVGCYFLVILCSDVMTIHFFYLVRNKGSWMEIGNSISHFGIVSAQVVFVLLLFALTNIYTKDIQTRSGKQFSRKDI
ncbi:uncharacterized protein LOC141712059 isoform X4 [Apium graveolens]|uniref:uncharacterized protein LOC141712059 isoform X4 n=1 Tax=Apium graveolens TaxID=4045 RepID=UPI003D78B500